MLDFRLVFYGLAYPALVVTKAGVIEYANRAAVALLGPDIEQRSLMEFAINPAQLKTFLHRSSGSSHPMPGKIDLRDAAGEARPLRSSGRLIRPPNALREQPLLLLEIRDGHERFSMLARQIQDLNVEMGKRMHLQAGLEESLRQRELLMRELQHRVRNNLQMISSMLTVSKNETSSLEAKAKLEEAASRIRAMAAVQQVFYSLEQSDAIPAARFIAELCGMLQAGPLADVKVTTDLEAISLPNDLAAPIALILNELLINAAKYGRTGDGDDSIAIGLKQLDGEIVLSVRDHGPGFDLPETRRRSSGLGLVRGLARQLGAKFDVQRQEEGACCLLRVPSPSPRISLQ